MKALESAGLKYLASLKERDLQSQIVEPLLTQLGYKEVRDNGGSGDLGKDVLAVHYEWGKPILNAIQIKKLQFTGKHNDSKSISFILNQLEQMVCEKVIDPITNEERLPDRAIFITPYTINRDALEASIAKRKILEGRGIRIIDGPTLFDLASQHIPEELNAANREYQYRVRVSTSCDRIRESIALTLNKELSLEHIFVEISPALGDMEIQNLPRYSLELKGPVVLAAPRKELKALRNTYAAVLGKTQQPWSDPSPETAKARLDLERKRKNEDAQFRVYIKSLKTKGDKTGLLKAKKEYADFLSKEIVEVNIDAAITHFKEKAENYTRQLRSVESDTITEEEGTRILDEGFKLAKQLRAFRSLSVVQEYWQSFSITDNTERLQSSHYRFSANAILKLGQSVFITGPAGAGKTTLLRRLAMTMAKQSTDRLPLLLYAGDLSFTTMKDLVSECKGRLRGQGYKISMDSLRKAFRKGEYRLFIDGLDEAGAYCAKLQSDIKRFSKEFPHCPVVVTIRDNYGLNMSDDAVHIRLTPFDDDQLAQFFAKWFITEPTKLERITSWLKTNPAMRESARTPLIAALLCTLITVDAEIPSTEIELYERRFELLLGKWEQAKGFETLPLTARTAYWHFLMNLAYKMHLKELKLIPYTDAVDACKECVPDDLRDSSDSIVRDCIRRGLLEYENQDRLSFGHLTYQDFLAARRLCQDNPVPFIFEKLTNSWWWKALDMYAVMKGNLTALVEEALLRRPGNYAWRLESLVRLAPFTSKNAIWKFGAEQNRLGKTA